MYYNLPIVSIRKIFVGLCLMAGAFSLQSVHAQTTVISSGSNIGMSSGSSGNIWLGFRFQVGPVAQRISEWSATFYANDPTVTVRLYSVDLGTGFPNSAPLATVSVSQVAGVNTYTATDLGAIATTTLNANAAYALVLGGSPGGEVSWRNATSPTFSAGFSSVGDGQTLVTTNGVTGPWVASSGFLATELKVAAAPLPGPTATTAIPTLQTGALWALGLGVMVLGGMLLRRKPI